MNARVFLLLLVTAAFMAVWDADRPVAGRVALAQAKSQRVGVSVDRAASHLALSATSLQGQVVPDQMITSEFESLTVGSDALIPLLKSLKSGTWQAISRDGDTFRLKIAHNSPGSDSASGNTLRSKLSE